MRGGCPVRENRVYATIVNYTGSIVKGQRIRVGVVGSFSMGPDGVVRVLHWGLLMNGEVSKIEDFISLGNSSDKPIRIEEDDKTEEGGIEDVDESGMRDMNGKSDESGSSAMFFIIPIVLIILVIVLFLVLRNRH